MIRLPRPRSVFRPGAFFHHGQAAVVSAAAIFVAAFRRTPNQQRAFCTISTDLRVGEQVSRRADQPVRKWGRPVRTASTRNYQGWAVPRVEWAAPLATRSNTSEPAGCSVGRRSTRVVQNWLLLFLKADNHCQSSFCKSRTHSVARIGDNSRPDCLAFRLPLQMGFGGDTGLDLTSISLVLIACSGQIAFLCICTCALAHLYVPDFSHCT